MDLKIANRTAVVTGGAGSIGSATAVPSATQGVLINAVAPAFIATNMTDKMMEQRAEEKNMAFDEAVDTFLEEERPHLVLDRRGRPEEIAAVIALWGSEHASFATGANYRVDGGSVLALDT